MSNRFLLKLMLLFYSYLFGQRGGSCLFRTYMDKLHGKKIDMLKYKKRLCMINLPCGLFIKPGNLFDYR